MEYTLPVLDDQLKAITAEYPTPFHLYDERGIRDRARLLQRTMNEAGVPRFQNYFAVKALPNPEILKLLVQEGMGADCSSLAELAIAEMCGLSGEQIMFSSNDTALDEFRYASGLGAIINFDDLSMVQPYINSFGAPEVGCCRFNPGDIEFGGVNVDIIGNPREAKYGMPLDDMITAYKQLKEAGVTRFGIHTMLLSNELDWRNHEEIADALFGAATAIAHEVGINFEFINLGGGIGVPYRPTEHEFDLRGFAIALKKLYDAHDLERIGSPRIVMENGRYITADSGYLVTTVANIKQTHKVYVGLDASMSDLMRPALYGAYHHMSVLGKQHDTDLEEVDVTGSLCENNDKFAIDRMLPHLEVGDVLVIHTTGAHGHAMGFQYNGKLRHAELLLDPGGGVRMIRRAETLEDYFATLTQKGNYHVPTN